MTNIHFLNGSFVSEEELLISPRDLGYSRGYAVFELIRTYPHHKPFILEKHIDRLYQSAASISLSIPWEKKQIIKWVFDTLAKNKTADEKVLRIVISGGPSNTLVPPKTPTIMIIVDSFFVFAKEMYEDGVSVHLIEFERYKANAKTNNYIELVRNIHLFESLSIAELIYHSDNIVREGACSNIFAVINNRLLTPQNNILYGITRGVLLETLTLDIPIVVEDFSVDDLKNASEVFLSVSAKEVVPVTKIDNNPIGDGKVGLITKTVMNQFHDYTLSDLW